MLQSKYFDQNNIIAIYHFVINKKKETLYNFLHNIHLAKKALLENFFATWLKSRTVLDKQKTSISMKIKMT